MHGLPLLPSGDASHPEWSDHPLTAALLSNAATGLPLVEGTIGLLQHTALGPNTTSTTRPPTPMGDETMAVQLWRACRPFFAYLLLSGDASVNPAGSAGGQASASPAAGIGRFSEIGDAENASETGMLIENL